MMNRTRQGSTEANERMQADVLLREYDNLAGLIKTLLTGQYSLGAVGVGLILGLVGAAVQLGRGEILVGLPTGLLLIACGVGIQLAMMHYTDLHLVSIEKRLNGLCSGSTTLPLTWYGRYSFPNLGDDRGEHMHGWRALFGSPMSYARAAREGDPMAGWLVCSYILIVGTYIALLVLGAQTTAVLLPLVTWAECVAAAIYLLFHVVFGAALVSMFAGARKRAVRTYREQRERRRGRDLGEEAAAGLADPGPRPEDTAS